MQLQCQETLISCKQDESQAGGAPDVIRMNCPNNQTNGQTQGIFNWKLSVSSGCYRKPCIGVVGILVDMIGCAHDVL